MEHAIIRHLPLVLAAALGAGARPAGGAEPQLAHMVFFTLKDHCPEARRRLVAACHEHLSGHEGTVSFSVGTIAEDVVEPVSDRDFDVALHLLFENKAAIAAYQKSAAPPEIHRGEQGDVVQGPGLRLVPGPVVAMSPRPGPPRDGPGSPLWRRVDRRGKRRSGKDFLNRGGSSR